MLCSASFIAMAEQTPERRFAGPTEMIATVENLVNCQCSTLPDDWLEMDMLWIASGSAADGLAAAALLARDEFFRFSSTAIFLDLPVERVEHSGQIYNRGEYVVVRGDA